MNVYLAAMNMCQMEVDVGLMEEKFSEFLCQLKVFDEWRNVPRERVHLFHPIKPISHKSSGALFLSGYLVSGKLAASATAAAASAANDDRLDHHPPVSRLAWPAVADRFDFIMQQQCLIKAERKWVTICRPQTTCCFGPQTRLIGNRDRYD